MAHHHEWATAIIPACAALAGAGLVGWLAACRERAARRHAILREQLEKFYQTACLLSQPFIRDPNQTVGDLIKGVIARTGENIQVRRFARFRLGE